jgi:hypothetical protein
MQPPLLSFPLSSKFGERKKQIPLCLPLEKGEIKKNFLIPLSLLKKDRVMKCKM